jgi:GT2 family glycosyltransferase
MYSEEVEWAHRVRAAGWRIVYLPSASIVHHEGGSSRADLPARQINFDTSKVLLYETLHGKRVAGALRVFLLGSYLVRAGIEAGKGALGHKRTLRVQRVKLYLSAFKSGLRGRSESR